MKLAVILSFLIFVSAFAGTDLNRSDLEFQKTKLNADLAKISVRIQEADSLLKEDAKRYVVIKNRYEVDLKRRHAEIDTLNAKLKKLSAELRTEESRQSVANSRIRVVKSRRKALNAELLQICRRLKAQVEMSIPWNKESRLDRIQALTRDIETRNASDEEAFSRLKSLIIEETRFGDEIAFISSPLTRKNGETVNARILRIGNQWMVYVDENAKVYGALVRKETKGVIRYEWNENLNLAERNAILLALDVKQARKPPQMITLPLSISVSKEAK